MDVDDNDHKFERPNYERSPGSRRSRRSSGAHAARRRSGKFEGVIPEEGDWESSDDNGMKTPPVHKFGISRNQQSQFDAMIEKKAEDKFREYLQSQEDAAFEAVRKKHFQEQLLHAGGAQGSGGAVRLPVAEGPPAHGGVAPLPGGGGAPVLAEGAPGLVHGLSHSRSEHVLSDPGVSGQGLKSVPKASARSRRPRDDAAWRKSDEEGGDDALRDKSRSPPGKESAKEMEKETAASKHPRTPNLSLDFAPLLGLWVKDDKGVYATVTGGTVHETEGVLITVTTEDNKQSDVKFAEFKRYLAAGGNDCDIEERLRAVDVSISPAKPFQKRTNQNRA